MSGNTLIADIFTKIEAVFETDPQYETPFEKLELIASLIDELETYSNELAEGL